MSVFRSFSQNMFDACSIAESRSRIYAYISSDQIGSEETNPKDIFGQLIGIIGDNGDSLTRGYANDLSPYCLKILTA